MKVLGIDPGFTGAWAIVGDDGVEKVGDCPIIRIKSGKKNKSMLNLLGVFDIVSDYFAKVDETGEDRLAILEKVGPMPKQGVTSCFRFGEASMAWEMALVCCGVAYERPRPQSWKKVMLKDIPGSDGKGRSILAVQRIFPNAPLMKTDRCRVPSADRAEAILMAEYGRRMRTE